MTYVIEGQSADLNTDFSAVVLALLNNAGNWTEGTVGFANIVFGQGNYDGNKDHEVMVLPLTETLRPDVLGGLSTEVESYCNVHIWIRTATANKLPAVDLQAMKTQVETILTQNRTTFGQGIRAGYPPSWGAVVLDDKDDFQTLWHTVGRVKAQYRKVSST